MPVGPTAPPIRKQPGLGLFNKLRQQRKLKFNHIRPVHIKIGNRLAFVPATTPAEAFIKWVSPQGSKDRIPQFDNIEQLANMVEAAFGSPWGDLVQRGIQPVITGSEKLSQDQLKELTTLAKDLERSIIKIQDGNIYALGETSIRADKETLITYAGIHYRVNEYGSAEQLKQLATESGSTLPVMPPMELPQKEETTLITGPQVEGCRFSGGTRLGEANYDWVAASTEAGGRDYNQDGFLLRFHPSTGNRYMVLADGAGGHAGGETASEIALLAVGNMIDNPTGGTRLQFIRQAVEVANKSVHYEGQLNPAKANMITTLVMVEIQDNEARIIHAGDSRVYRVTGTGEVSQLTRDQSFAMYSAEEELYNGARITPPIKGQWLRDIEGFISRFQASNIILGAVGLKETIDAETIIQQLEHGDWLLVCSDGLHGVLRYHLVEQLQRFRQEGYSIHEAQSKLRYEAEQAGWDDNVTILLYDHAPGPRPFAAEKLEQANTQEAMVQVLHDIRDGHLAVAREEQPQLLRKLRQVNWFYQWDESVTSLISEILQKRLS